MQTDYNNLQARVMRLEHQNRRWRTAALLLLVVMALIISLGAVQNNDAPMMTPARALRAQSFLLTDANGNVHARWMLKDGEPVLQFYSPEGKVVWSAPPQLRPHELADQTERR